MKREFYGGLDHAFNRLFETIRLVVQWSVSTFIDRIYRCLIMTNEKPQYFSSGAMKPWIDPNKLDSIVSDSFILILRDKNKLLKFKRSHLCLLPKFEAFRLTLHNGTPCISDTNKNVLFHSVQQCFTSRTDKRFNAAISPFQDIAQCRKYFVIFCFFPYIFFHSLSFALVKLKVSSVLKSWAMRNLTWSLWQMKL